MLDYKKPVIIADADITLLFKLFGFETLNSNELEMDQIIVNIQKDAEMYAIIFIASNIILTPKQRKLLNSLNIPISHLPMRAIR